MTTPYDSAQVSTIVTTNVAEFFARQYEEIAPLGQPVRAAIELLEQYVLGGGKRIRPLYAWAGFVAGGGLESGLEDPQVVLRAVSSLEFIQACALIHDDIIDSSDTRRGSPTIHRAVEQRHRREQWLGDAEHFAQSVAILVGDMAFAWADDMFHSAGLSAAALGRALPAWRGMRTEVIGGQLLDVVLEASGNEDIAAAETVNRFKTAAYTIERPLHIGAAIAGASSEMIAALRAYGEDIGVAFQLRDDQLGVFGDPSVTGKPAGDDLREGKRTVLIATALSLAEEQGDVATVELIRSKLGTVAGPADIAALTAAIAGTGAAEHVEKLISELTARGLAHLDGVSLAPENRELLHALAIRATARRT